MKAIVYREYGPADVLRCEEVEKPVPRAGEVLIRVRAASVNPVDWHFMRGEPYFVRLMTGLRKPKIATLGVDVAGEVEAVGSGVTEFKAGDAVFGGCFAAFAEYVRAPAAWLALKPANVPFEHAAAAPAAAYTALQGLRDHGRIAPGQRVLINGAAGGVGTFAVQMAKAFGAHVTGVCSTANVEMVRSIGADRVIDYTREDFTSDGSRYDLVLDCVANRSLTALRRLLTPRGRYIGIGAPAGRWMFGAIGRAVIAMVLSAVTRKKMIMVLAKPRGRDVAAAGELMAAGKLTPVIDRRVALSEVPEAVRYVERGHARGKVVVVVSP